MLVIVHHFAMFPPTISNHSASKIDIKTSWVQRKSEAENNWCRQAPVKRHA